MASPSSCNSRKRQRREGGDPCCSYCAKRKHLYLALDDNNGGNNPGYTIHKIDAADNMELEDHLPEPVLRVAAPGRGPMAFTAVGTSIFVVTNPYSDRYDDPRAPPTIVYDTQAGALAFGPRLPGRFLEGGGAMAVGERLYGIARVRGKDSDENPAAFSVLQVMSWAPALCLDPWDPAMAWSWRQAQSTASLPLSTTLSGAVYRGRGESGVDNYPIRSGPNPIFEDLEKNFRYPRGSDPIRIRLKRMRIRIWD